MNEKEWGRLYEIPSGLLKTILYDAMQQDLTEEEITPFIMARIEEGFQMPTMDAALMFYTETEMVNAHISGEWASVVEPENDGL